LRWDPRTGDYGLNFFGHAYNSATYLVSHPEYGWQAFGGNVTVEASTIRLTPLDSFRKRVYLASVGLWLTLDAGRFEQIELDSGTGAVRVGLAPADAYTPAARLRVEQPALPQGAGSHAVSGSFAVERDAFVVPLGAATTWVDLTN
jgi:hypothetical protein